MAEQDELTQENYEVKVPNSPYEAPVSSPGEEKLAGKTRLAHRWWRAMDMRIGVLPLPVFVVLGLVIVALLEKNKLAPDLNTAIGLLALFGFALAEVGQRIPIVNKIGGAVILATFVPSALTYYHVLPADVVRVTSQFIDQSQLMYLFLAAIIVGSIFSMDGRHLLSGFLKIFVPLTAGTIAAAVVGTAVGMLLGMSAFHTFFFVVVPIMAGGIGEGAIPLAIGYALITGAPQGDMLAMIMPSVSLGGLTGVLFSGTLGALARKVPAWTGNGRLQVGETDQMDPLENTIGSSIEIADIAAAGATAIVLFLLGMAIQAYVPRLPGPVLMLLLAVVIKLVRAVPPKLEQGAFVVYKFTSVAITYPLLFAIGVARMPWDKLIAAFTLANLFAILATVATLMLVGALVGRRLGMFPIEAAIVNGCHSGMGGLGDVAILSAANRMVLMPFAQISTRIGGALTVLVVLTVLFPRFA